MTNPQPLMSLFHATEKKLQVITTLGPYIILDMTHPCLSIPKTQKLQGIPPLGK